MSVKCHEKFRVCTLEHPQKNQITLHTGVVYARHSSETFCAVSYSLEHGSQAVWSYLRPALEKLLQEKKGIDTLHFYSDGATAQYKQKGNFNLLSKEMSDRSICKATWNFHERVFRRFLKRNRKYSSVARSRYYRCCLFRF